VVGGGDEGLRFCDGKCDIGVDFLAFRLGMLGSAVCEEK